jgi:adenylosuccinate synthase
MEYGSTTGRPRRCGWIDLVALKFACMVNGVTQLVMTKADVLDQMEELEVCESYLVNAKPTREVPFQMMRENIEPVYKKFKGWQTDITTIKDYPSLPSEMKSYIAYINDSLQVPVNYISNGPGSQQIIVAS